MNRKKTMEVALLISAIFALLSVYWKFTDQPSPQPQPPAMEQQRGSNNNQLSGSENSLQVSQQERE